MTMQVPDNLLYTKDHEWAKHEGDAVVIGISHHAQHQLGDVVYLELPSVGKRVEAHKIFGVVESVKAVSDLFSPVSGEVIAVNEALVQAPEGVNSDPYGAAWMIKVKFDGELSGYELLDAAAYATYLAQEAK